MDSDAYQFATDTRPGVVVNLTGIDANDSCGEGDLQDADA
jgi:hypothetical protein